VPQTIVANADVCLWKQEERSPCTHLAIMHVRERALRLPSTDVERHADGALPCRLDAWRHLIHLQVQVRLLPRCICKQIGKLGIIAFLGAITKQHTTVPAPESVLPLVTICTLDHRLAARGHIQLEYCSPAFKDNCAIRLPARQVCK
jgi:hypothetical protein